MISFRTFMEMAKFTQTELESKGYYFAYKNSLPKSLMLAVKFSGELIAQAEFTQSEMILKSENPAWAAVWDDQEDKLKPNQMWVLMIEVDPRHQRKGIATAIYRLAEKISGNQIIRTPSRTPDSDALWKQPNRGFG